MSSLVCHHCGCNEIDTDPGRGDAVCTQCGFVLQDQIIVSEVQFAENAAGGASVMGQYVSSDGPKSMSLGGGFHHGMGKEWRQIALENGRGRIQRLGAQLKLNQYCIDTAFNFFKMAVNRRLTHGRKTNYVIAACVYLVCRTEGTSHMLLDLSDVLQTDVYTLGRTYLQLSKELCIRIPVCDPCLYIQRFAHRLEFGDKTHEVAMTALRLVQRMKRDWMAQGRRPSGLCGAALLVAGRIHDFNRKIKDIMRVVKIGEGTIRKRLAEFEATPSSQLTVDEFQNIDLEEEMDPPCFTEGKRKAKLQQLEEQGQLGKLTAEVATLQKEIEKKLAKENEKRFRNYKKFADCSTTDSDGQSSGRVSPNTSLRDSPSGNIDSFLLQETLKEVVSDTELNSIASNAKSLHIINEDISVPYRDSGVNGCAISGMRPRPSVTSLGITSSIEDYMTLTEDKPIEEKLDIEEEETQEGCELDLSGIDDEELDSFILSEKEVRIKTRIWMEANASYLKEQKEKLEREAKEKAEEASKPEHKKRKRAQRKPSSKHIEHSTAADAIKNMLQERKISSKINYDVLKDLNRTADPEEGTPKSVDSIQPFSHLSEATSLSAISQINSPLNVVKTEPVVKRIKTEDTVNELKTVTVKSESKPVIVESGPVQYHHTADLEEEDVENDEEDDEEEEQISAAKLLGHNNVDDDDYTYDVDDDDGGLDE